jgi:hypothetical protein
MDEHTKFKLVPYTNSNTFRVSGHCRHSRSAIDGDKNQKKLVDKALHIRVESGTNYLKPI